MFFEMSRVEKFILETVHFTWMVSASQRIIILVQSLHDHLFEKEKNLKTSLNWQAFVTLITKEVGSQLPTKLPRTYLSYQRARIQTAKKTANGESSIEISEAI